MANTVAYNNGSNPVGSIKKGVVSINIDNSLITSGLTWRNGIEFTNQYIIYSDTYTQGIDTQQNAKPCAWSCAYNDTALRDLINSLPPLIGQPKYNTLADAIAWLEGQNKYFLVNQNYPEIVTSGCVLNMDAGMSGSYPNAGTTWYDLTNTKNGDLTNGPTWINSGTSSCFSFDGSDDKVLFNANNFPQTYTKTAFFNANDTSTRNILSSSSPVDHAFWLSGGNLRSGHNGDYFRVGTPVNTNVWYFGTVTYSNDTNNMELFLNGVSKSTNTASSIGSGGDYKIGEHSSNQSFNGKISSVNLYNRVLSQSEILQNYYKGKLVTSGLTLALDAGNLVSYGGAGTTWYDMTSNGKNGTLTNGPTYSGGTVPSIVFDGTNDYVSLPTNVVGGFTGLTYGVWVYVNSLNNSGAYPGYIGAVVNNNASNNINLGIWINSTKQHIEVSTTQQQNQAYEGTIDVPIRQWYYASMTWDGTYLTEYVNGVKGLQVTTNGSILSDTTFFGLGQHGGGIYFFNGKISNVQVYNRALSASEIQQNFNTYRRRFGI